MTIITAEWHAMTILTLSLSCKRDLISVMHHQLPKNDELWVSLGFDFAVTCHPSLVILTQALLLKAFE